MHFLVSVYFNTQILIKDAIFTSPKTGQAFFIGLGRTEVSINLEVTDNWLCLCDLAHELFALTLLF